MRMKRQVDPTEGAVPANVGDNRCLAATLLQRVEGTNVNNLDDWTEGSSGLRRAASGAYNYGGINKGKNSFPSLWTNQEDAASHFSPKTPSARFRSKRIRKICKTRLPLSTHTDTMPDRTPPARD